MLLKKIESSITIFVFLQKLKKVNASHSYNFTHSNLFWSINFNFLFNW